MSLNQARSRHKVHNRYVGKKVIKVGSKLYTSLEKVFSINGGGVIVTLREVEFIESKYNHPIKGTIFNYKYEVVKTSLKVYMTLEEWEMAENTNEKDYNVETIK